MLFARQPKHNNSLKSKRYFEQRLGESFGRLFQSLCSVAAQSHFRLETHQMGSAAALNMASSISAISSASSAKLKFNNSFACAFQNLKRGSSITRICAIPPNGSVSSSAPHKSHGAECSAGDDHKQRSSLESLFCYDKAIPEEVIEKPVGIHLVEKFIGNNPRCVDCDAKGAVLCTTCSGSGLYVDSILESQGIIVKVRCLGCGGTGNIMCSECGGRGHRG